MRPERKRAAFLATLTVALVGVVGVGSAAVTPAVRCRPGSSRLIAADTQAVVYLGSVVERAFDTTIRTRIYLGCVRGGRNAYIVGGPGGNGSSSGAGGTRNLTINGAVVAWEEWEHTGVEGSERNEWVVLVRDLRSGRMLQKSPTGIARVRGWTGVGPTTDIVVGADGATAWIVRVMTEQGEQGYEVHAVDKTGARVLATGSSIAPNSLALAGGTLYWTQGGVAMSASLQ
jgi:hypothetical protein